jgi:Uma2 family endonuclease
MSSRTHVIEEWDKLPEPEGRRELVKWQLVEMAAAGRAHNLATARLWARLEAALPPEWVVLQGNEARLVTSFPPTVREPDVLVVRGAAYDADPWRGGYAPADVLLMVEFVSPETTRTDRVAKKAEYQAAGIEHYWLVDLRPTSRGARCLVFKLIDGKYQEQPGEHVPARAGLDSLVEIERPGKLSLRLAELIARR